MLKAAGYSGRPQAKFAYALSGSIDFLVNKPAQISQSIGSIGLYISAGLAIAAFVVEGSSSALAAEEKSLASSESANIIEEEASSASFFKSLTFLRLRGRKFPSVREGMPVRKGRVEFTGADPYVLLNLP
jgi:hypothetical protein